jgi:hypothetical protein
LQIRHQTSATLYDDAVPLSRLSSGQHLNGDAPSRGTRCRA